MGQEFHVLRCFSCNTFQVHIVKKSNKWNCKICGVQQSIIKVYGQGTAKDCRVNVQKLNMLSQLQNTEPILDDPNFSEISHSESLPEPLNVESGSCNSDVSIRNSKWLKFCNPNDTTDLDIMNPSDICNYDIDEKCSNYSSSSASSMLSKSITTDKISFVTLTENAKEEPRNNGVSTISLFHFDGDDEELDNILEI